MAVSYKKLWKLLIDRDMKKKELAQLAGISNFTISKMSAGNNVTVEVLGKICKALNCTPMELLGLRPEGDYLVDITPESGTIMERINQLPAARRNELQKTLEILIKGMEGEK